MKKKLRQITDAVHGTIYLSEFESAMMSSSYFHRLHDIYQSSTVYLTFPSNRTKRYEHSLGVMNLSSEVLRSAITNSSSEVQDDFFENLKDCTLNIIDEAQQGNGYSNLAYLSLEKYGRYKRTNSKYIKKDKYDSLRELSNCLVDNAFSGNPNGLESIADAALNYYMLPLPDSFIVNPLKNTAEDIDIKTIPIEIENKNLKDRIDNLKIRSICYQCLLQAVRLVALFHDIGHPPFSHILESTIETLYKECKKTKEKDESLLTSQQQELVDCYENIVQDNAQYFFDEKYSNNNSDLHERIGLRLMQESFKKYFDKKIFTESSPFNVCLYHIIVAEFCFAILQEKGMFFKSIHKIIAGIIDVDRGDYILRDTRNSGLNFGEIPYKRLFNSCRFMHTNNDSKDAFVLAFPKKMTTHIDDFLIIRYRIFAEINYHHHVYKTSALMQQIVQELAKDYLYNENKKENNKRFLCEEIKNLWTSFSFSYSDNTASKIINWNDSVLLSYLYKTYAEIEFINDSSEYFVSSDKFNQIKSMIAELLLNEKYFYSILKRQSDIVAIMNDIKIKGGILTPDEIDSINASVSTDTLFASICKNAINAAKQTKTDKDEKNLEDLKQLSKCFYKQDLQEVYDKLDIKEIDIFESSVYNALDTSNIVIQHHVEKNPKRLSFGFPTDKEDVFDYIYLYDSNTLNPTVETYDTNILQQRLALLADKSPFYMALAAFTKNSNIDDEIKKARTSISDIFVKNFNTRLFLYYYKNASHLLKNIVLDKGSIDANYLISNGFDPLDNELNIIIK